MSRIVYLCFVFVAIGCMASASHSAYAQASKARFQNLSTADGLSNDVVTSLLQDKYGFLWVGTTAGLNRYDGYEFKIFDSSDSDSTGLHDESVRSVYEDSNGDIWVGTKKGGLHRFDAINQTFDQYDIAEIVRYSGVNKEFFNDVYRILEASPSKLWLGTKGGLVLFDLDETVASYIDLGTDKPQTIKDLIISSEGDLWIATESGDVIRKPFSQAHIEENSNVIVELQSEYAITSFSNDPNGDLWMGTDGGGLLRYRSSANRLLGEEFIQPVALELISNSISEVQFDNSGRLWIGYFSAGLSLLRTNGELENFANAAGENNSLINDYVLDIKEADDGSIWVGTWGGLSWLSEHFEAIQSYAYSQEKNILKSVNAVAFEQGRDEEFWLGTLGEGLVLFQADTEEFIRFEAQQRAGDLCGSVILDLHIDSQNNLWIATEEGGACKVNLDRWKKGDTELEVVQYNKESKGPYTLSSNDVNSVLEANDGSIWMGLYNGGIDVLDASIGSKKAFNDSLEAGGLLSNTVWPIVEDRTGVLWIGAFEGGLMKYDPEEGVFEDIYLGNDHPETQRIYDLFIDSRNALWVATDDGVKRIDLTSMDQMEFQIQDGLVHNEVRGITQDEAGDVWFTTNSGISRYTPDHDTFKNFYLEDGLQGNVFYARAAFKASDGRLFFGGANGFNIIDPSKISVDPVSRSVFLTKILVNNEIYEISGEPPPYLRENLVLEYYENRFSLSFSSLNFWSQNQINYKYRLNKVDSKWYSFQSSRIDSSWTNLDTRNDVTFPLQAYGDYEFEVLATNSDGVWSSEGLKLPITIKTPWYAQAWFRSLIVLSILGAIVGGLLLRLRIERREAALLLEGERREAAILLDGERKEAEFRLETERKEAEFRLEAERMQSEYQLGIERLRLKIAQGLHDDVGASLATIAIQLSLMKSKLQLSEKDKERIRKLGAMVRKTGQTVRETGWVINTKFDNLPNLINQMRELALLMLDGQRNYTFKQSPTPMPNQRLGMAFKQNVYYLFKEALNNANKYSDAANVDIEVVHKDNSLAVRVTDNGIGFEMDAIKEGSGLGNMKDRAAEIGATYEMDSTPGRGTSITLTAPIMPLNPLDAKEVMA